jgi:hypothetical protein
LPLWYRYAELKRERKADSLAADLPYVYSTEGVIKEPNLFADAGQGLLNSGMSYLRCVYTLNVKLTSSGDTSGMLKGLMGYVAKYAVYD